MGKEKLFIKDGVPLEYNITFHNDAGQIGELNWGDGELKFKGNMQESARKFFDFLKTFVDEYIAGEK